MSRQIRRLGGLALPLLAVVLGACAPESILGSKQLPPDVSDPTLAKTPDGALAAYHGAVSLFSQAFGGSPNGVIIPIGLLTDELEDGELGAVGETSDWMPVDARTLPEFADPGLEGDRAYVGAYGALQRTRGQIQEALGALAAYAPAASPAFSGRLYALEGYAEVLLADLFCSGIPLSTLEFEGDYTYQPGSTTQEVYQRALAHFDSARALAADSAEVVLLARVGRARTLLDLGDYTGAGEAAAEVPDAFLYVTTYSNKSPYWNIRPALQGTSADGGSWRVGAGVADQEGGNGLPYRTSQDPRTKAVSIGHNRHLRTRYMPAKYAADGSSPIVLASGVEARLIEAEVQLHAGDPSWLATLNVLRTDGTFDTQQDPVDTTKTDTLWHAGSGGVSGLAPLSDPGTPEARVDLVFQERGYWLYLTGQRLGDFRRLVRVYGRNPEQVYPTGSYLGLNGRYGRDVNAPIPATERLYNSKFTGCLSRGA